MELNITDRRTLGDKLIITVRDYRGDLVNKSLRVVTVVVRMCTSMGSQTLIQGALHWNRVEYRWVPLNLHTAESKSWLIQSISHVLNSMLNLKFT